MYEVVIHRKVCRELKQVPKTYLRIFSALVNVLKTNPRIGDYRVVYFVDKQNQAIHGLKFERREKVY